MNPAALQLMRSVEGDIKEFLPHFDANNLIGEKVDIFHRRPEHQTKYLATLDSTNVTSFKIGERTFEITLSPMFDEQRQRMGTVVEWVDISERLAREAEDKRAAEKEKVVLAEMARIKSALDSCSSKVMMCDESGDIVYANKAVSQMLLDSADEIRKEFPKLDLENLVGVNLENFNSDKHNKLISNQEQGYETVVTLGSKPFGLLSNPVLDDEGNRLGIVVEWNDKLAELKFEEEVNNLILAATAGKLDDRIQLDTDCSPFITNISEGINQLLEVFDNVIKDACASLSSLAEGRLTRRMEGNYDGSFEQLKSDVNTTIDKLVSVVTEIADSATRVKSASTEITRGNSDLSLRTEQQAASLEETSSAMEEITATVQQNAENSVQANTLARGAREAAENGGSVVGRAVSAMEAISESSKKINDIIGVIDEIAFQTNLLALNAAVEAARAGDQGRGFAVVADEVRSLAGRSATAAKEIKELIKDSGNKVNEGSELVNRSGETLDEIVTAVKKVNDIVAEIATASDEQSTGLGEISKSITEMDNMTQQNAALVEEAAAASESMNSQADTLDRLIAFFDTGVKRKPASAVDAPVAPAAKRVAASSPGKRVDAVKSSADQAPKQSAAKVPSVPVAPPVEDEGDEWEVF
jgi:methyl-accepting chemotaxis protein